MLFYSLAVLALGASQIHAFPSQLSEVFLQGKRAALESAAEEFAERAIEAEPECPFAKARAMALEKRQAPGIVPPFDPTLQYVSNKGAHAFKAPSGNDQRGPCPGLNAMANHGYLPHNGVGSISDFITGTTAAFGMGVDLAAFLAVYGAIFDGDLTKYSIGGPYPGLLNLGGLLGAPQGLSGSHNKYEGDVSPTRGDLYQYGNDYLLQMSQFKALYKLGVENGGTIDLALLTKYRNTRFQESINKNPYFFNAPFAGVLAQPAAWSFIYRFMANKSAEYPEGRLDLPTLKSFYSITGDYPNFKYTPGHEKFPNNWYKRHPLDYYTIPYLEVDTVAMALEYPEFVAVGGNTGKVNSFVGVNIQNLTSSAYSASTLLEGNNLVCFGLEASLMEGPDILTGLYSDINPAMDLLGSAVNNATKGLGCPKLNEISKNQFAAYPGYTKLKTNGKY